MSHIYTSRLQAVSHSISSYTDDMCDVADDNSSDDAASDVDRCEVQQSDTPSTSATTDTAVSAPVDNVNVNVNVSAFMYHAGLITQL